MLTKYGDLLRKSPYLVRIQENTDQKKLRIFGDFSHSDANLNRRVFIIKFEKNSGKNIAIFVKNFGA